MLIINMFVYLYVNRSYLCAPRSYNVITPRDRTDGKNKSTIRYYYPRLKQKVYEYVRNCLVCAKRNPTYSKRLWMITPDQIYNLFDKIYVDLFGPITETPRKK